MEAAKLTKFRGKWCVCYRAANVRRDEVVTESKRVSLRTADRAVAERRFEQWKAELKRTDETKVLAAWNVYIEDKGTQRAAYAGLNLLPFFASYDTNDIGLDLCRSYIEHRKSQLTKKLHATGRRNDPQRVDHAPRGVEPCGTSWPSRLQDRHAVNTGAARSVFNADGVYNVPPICRKEPSACSFH